MKAIVNRWIGETHQNNAVCQVCRNKTSLAVIPLRIIGTTAAWWEVGMCKTCLTEAIQAIDKAIQEDLMTNTNQGPVEQLTE